jgi:hypothetical protein
MLLQKDLWVGKAITSARIAYESWAGLLAGEFRIEPADYSGPVSGRYAGLFGNYAKEAFLGAVAILHRGFFKLENAGFVKKKAAYRMLEVVSEEQMDELLRLTTPLRDFRDKDQHRENPNHPEVWSVVFKPSRPIIGTVEHGYIDPFPIYELLKSLEPTIGWIAFVKSGIEAMSKVASPPDGTGSPD